MGGLSWFAIPVSPTLLIRSWAFAYPFQWLCATTMGLAALSLESSPSFPTFPNRMTSADVSAGLVVPYAAVALLGKGGAVCTLLLVFMAVTSAFSAQLIAVSSIFTYDIYQTYFNPEASGNRLIYTSHTMVLAFGVFIAAFSTGLYYAGISMGYLYLLMGVIISAAVLPATLTLMWKRQNKWAAMLSPPLGLCCSVTAWLVTAKRQGGTLTVATTGANNPMLAGNVVALLSPLVTVPVLTFALGAGKPSLLSHEMCHVNRAR
jgi:Na+/proline symporter